MSLRRIFPSLCWPLFALFLMLILNLSFARISRLPCNKVQLMWSENFYNFLHCVPGPELKLRDSLNNTSPVFAPCKGIQNSLGFWIPHHWFRIPFTWFRILCQLNLDSGFQSLVGFRIPWVVFQIPTPRIPDSGNLPA